MSLLVRIFQKMKKFNFLLVGTGNIASTYVKAAANIPEIAITGIVSRSGRRPEGAESLPVFPSIREAECEFDAVILATPNGCHCSGCLEAAELGKHVFTEKTLASNREDMDKMISACKSRHLQLAVAFQRRTAPDNIIVRRMLRSGELGKVIACELACNFWRPDSYYENSTYRGGFAIDGGGVFIQQASHNLDIYVWFFGLPEQLHAFTGTFLHPMEGEDYGAAICRHSDGMIGTLIASTASKPGLEAAMTIRTSKGFLTMEGDRITRWEIEGVDNPSESAGVELHSGAATNVVAVTRGHEILLKDFAEKCVSGEKVLVSGEDARDALELILRIYESK